MSNLHKFKCKHVDFVRAMDECLRCLRNAVDTLEETNEWGGWEDQPYETGKPPYIVILPEYLPWNEKDK